MKGRAASILARTGNCIRMHVFREQMLNVLISVDYTVMFLGLWDGDHCEAARLNSSRPPEENIDTFEKKKIRWTCKPKVKCGVKQSILPKRPCVQVILTWGRCVFVDKNSKDLFLDSWCYWRIWLTEVEEKGFFITVNGWSRAVILIFHELRDARMQTCTQHKQTFLDVFPALHKCTSPFKTSPNVRDCETKGCHITFPHVPITLTYFPSHSEQWNMRKDDSRPLLHLCSNMAIEEQETEWTGPTERHSIGDVTAV